MELQSAIKEKGGGAHLAGIHNTAAFLHFSLNAFCLHWHLTVKSPEMHLSSLSEHLKELSSEMDPAESSLIP